MKLRKEEKVAIIALAKTMSSVNYNETKIVSVRKVGK